VERVYLHRFRDHVSSGYETCCYGQSADASFVVVAAGVLETLQLMTSDRHGRIADMFVKASGGAFCVAVALIILILVERCKPFLKR
jgi:hypothetical protein